MFVVHYFDNRNLLLTQLRSYLPSVGEDIKVKGKKGKVSSVTSVDETVYHVQITLEVIKKVQLTALAANKKRK